MKSFLLVMEERPRLSRFNGIDLRFMHDYWSSSDRRRPIWCSGKDPRFLPDGLTKGLSLADYARRAKYMHLKPLHELAPISEDPEDKLAESNAAHSHATAASLRNVNLLRSPIAHTAVYGGEVHAVLLALGATSAGSSVSASRINSELVKRYSFDADSLREAWHIDDWAIDSLKTVFAADPVNRRHYWLNAELHRAAVARVRSRSPRAARDDRERLRAREGRSERRAEDEERYERYGRSAREGRLSAREEPLPGGVREELPARRIIREGHDGSSGRAAVSSKEPIVLQGRLRRPADRSVVTDDDREQHLREHAHGLKSGTVQRWW